MKDKFLADVVDFPLDDEWYCIVEVVIPEFLCNCQLNKESALVLVVPLTFHISLRCII